MNHTDQSSDMTRWLVERLERVGDSPTRDNVNVNVMYNVKTTSNTGKTRNEKTKSSKAVYLQQGVGTCRSPNSSSRPTPG